MKLLSTLLAALVTSAAAAPAIVWSGESNAQIHTSEFTGLRSLVETNAALESVVFIVERDENGSEGLTGLTTSGSLPKVASKYSEASAIHHSVRGMETFNKVTKELGAVTAVTLEDYVNDSGANKAAINNDGKISGHVTLVKIPNDASPSTIDSVVTSAIEDSTIGSVVLTSVRGVSEVRFERDLRSKNELNRAKKYHGRRLEDAEEGDDEDPMYFVHFTPNIFSGLMFFFFFASVTYIGIGCMGMIAGQEVYVTKYPTVGREA